MTVFREEVFGPPLATAYPQDLDQAIALANDSPLRYGAATFTRDAVGQRDQDAAVAVDGHTPRRWVRLQGNPPDQVPRCNVECARDGSDRSGVVFHSASLARRTWLLWIGEDVHHNYAYNPLHSACRYLEF